MENLAQEHKEVQVIVHWLEKSAKHACGDKLLILNCHLNLFKEIKTCTVEKKKSLSKCTV